MNPNDPMSQFRERYQQYVETKAPTSPPVMNASGGKGFFNKFYVQGLIVGVVIIVSGVLVYLNFKPSQSPTLTNTTQAPSQPFQRKKVALTEQQIDDELMRTWGQYYSQVKDDRKIREYAKNNLTKRIIVFAGATDNKINMSTIASDNPVLQEMKVEDELKLKVLSWRNIDYAYVYIDPTITKYASYPERATYSLNLIKSNLSNGSTFEEAYEAAKKDSKFFKPIEAYYNKVFYKNEWGNSVSELLFKYGKGQNTEIIAPPGGVFILAHINDANDTQFSTMEEWLKSQNQ